MESTGFGQKAYNAAKMAAESAAIIEKFLAE